MHASAAAPRPRDKAGPAAAVGLTNVSVTYGRTQALRSVTLDAPPRAITALIGPSGCGKTTLLRSINRLNDIIPSFRLQGDIALFGASVYGGGLPVEELRRRIGMLFQRPAPLPLSIYDDVAYGPRLHGMTRSRAALGELVEESLRRAALWDEVKDRLRHPGRALSGGQQQRLCLARALAVKPEVVLMDEPCSALDPVATAKIEELMHELAREITVIIVTHNLQQARRVADFTAMMLGSADGPGELVEVGPTTALFERPRDARTADYLEGRFG